MFRQKKAKTGWGSSLRLVIWLAWLGFIIFLFIKAGGIKTADALYQSEGVISILNPVIVFIYLGVIMLVFIMMLIWGNRAFCKYICWMAPFMMVGNRIRYWLKIPGLYLKSVKENCIECGRCTKQCPMGIDVQAMVLADDCYNSECIMCLGCVDICPKSAIITK